MRFGVRDRRALRHLAQGHIGLIAEDYVEGRLEIEARPRDLMRVAQALLGSDPVDGEAAGLRAVLDQARKAMYDSEWLKLTAAEKSDALTKLDAQMKARGMSAPAK